jgi:hypothetical protein
MENTIAISETPSSTFRLGRGFPRFHGNKPNQAAPPILTMFRGIAEYECLLAWKNGRRSLLTLTAGNSLSRHWPKVPKADE